MPKLLLDVGSNAADFPPPIAYQGYKRVRLDLDPLTEPDILADARELAFHIQPRTYDAAYASHLIEHFNRSDAIKVLHGILHILKDGGTIEVRCPDIGALMRRVLAHGLDLEDFLYMSNAGPIRPIDVLYGYQPEIEASGKDYMAHRYGYTERSLTRLLQEAGFTSIVLEAHSLELVAYAKKEHIQ